MKRPPANRSAAAMVRPAVCSWWSDPIKRIRTSDAAMTPSQQHDTDFYGRTQDQAALLRALPRNAKRLDIENLAEEIEDMGRAEIKDISSLFRQTLVHLVKIAFDPEAPPAAHWVGRPPGFRAMPFWHTPPA